ncbi:3-oxoacyl-[acyl-carrier protein] reductase [Nocardia kruczakiae]|uniref:3-oxoacyl-[acyl-carrier protein] reductase n=1 Tax=Nocardia kruczakiae TaxID=261477 RepID=A0ABU1XPT2_9NOCA|nr:SDR family oxidoreductase [Nocardia kruczakiae]MDR7172570.1 3-oxoacyl-[acyl-carrier protein] reductase [Nocardia kruczakiae]
MRTALVTGSSRGIGRAIAVRLAAPDTTVVVNYRTDADAAARTAEQINQRGGRAITIAGDVADPEQLRTLLDHAERDAGTLDVVVANAGAARFAPVAETTDEDFDAMFATNTRATFQLLRAAATRIRDGGRIVVVSSGVTVTHRPGSGAYAASKAASEALVRVLAREVGHRSVTVNAVRPGPTRTAALTATVTPDALQQTAQTIPLGRIGEPDDIAGIVAFLASPDAAWLTGQLIDAGGGSF